MKMIKSEKGKVTIKGSKAEIVAELTCLMNGLIEGGIMTDDEIVHALAVATMSESERKDAIKKAMSNIFAEFFKEDK